LEEKSREQEYQDRTELLRLKSLPAGKERQTLVERILAGSEKTSQITR